MAKASAEKKKRPSAAKGDGAATAAPARLGPKAAAKPGKGKTSREGLDERIVKAISHPLRHQLLVLLNERVASPNELANELGERLGSVSYHVRQLLDAGAIELVSTAPRRGAVEHYYRAITRAWFSDEDWLRLPKTTRRNILGQHLDRIAADVVAAADRDGFDHPQAHVSFSHFELDGEGVSAMSALLSETLERALDIHAESMNRRAQAGADEMLPTELVLLHFEREPGKRGGSSRRSTSGSRKRR
jgi:DNA-binding transcriptional ArsR family regulator